MWKTEHRHPNFDPKPTLERLCELVEQEMETFARTDPDPLDDRHPSEFYACLGIHWSVFFIRMRDAILRLVAYHAIIIIPYSDRAYIAGLELFASLEQL